MSWSYSTSICPKTADKHFAIQESGCYNRDLEKKYVKEPNDKTNNLSLT